MSLQLISQVLNNTSQNVTWKEKRKQTSQPTALSLPDPWGGNYSLRGVLRGPNTMIANINILFLGFCFIKCKLWLCGVRCFQCLTGSKWRSGNMAMTFTWTAMVKNDLLCLLPHLEFPELFNCVEDSWNCAWTKTARLWPVLFYCYSVDSLLVLTKYSPSPQKYLWFINVCCNSLTSLPLGMYLRKCKST